MTTRVNVAPKRPPSLIIDENDDHQIEDFRTPPAPKYPFFGKSPSSDTTSSECSPDTPENVCYGLYSEKHLQHVKRHNPGHQRIYYMKLGTSIDVQITSVVDYSFIKEQNLSLESWIKDYKEIWDDASYVGMLDNKTFKRSLY